MYVVACDRLSAPFSSISAMVSTETERAVSTIGVLDLVAPKDVSSPRTIWLSSCTASSAFCVSVPASAAITAELTDMTATARSHGLSVVFILPPVSNAMHYHYRNTDSQ